MSGQWRRQTWQELAGGANQGRRGQGPVVEAMRRLSKSASALSGIMIVLSVVQILPLLLEVGKRCWVGRWVGGTAHLREQASRPWPGGRAGLGLDGTEKPRGQEGLA